MLTKTSRTWTETDFSKPQNFNWNSTLARLITHVITISKSFKEMMAGLIWVTSTLSPKWVNSDYPYQRSLTWWKSPSLLMLKREIGITAQESFISEGEAFKLIQISAKYSDLTWRQLSSWLRNSLKYFWSTRKSSSRQLSSNSLVSSQQSVQLVAKLWLSENSNELWSMKRPWSKSKRHSSPHFTLSRSS